MPHGVVSADSHMMEPADLWQERLDKRFRDRAPEVIENPDEGPKYLFVAEGAAPFAVAGGFAAGRSGKELSEFLRAGYEAARPSGWDPVERIKDQEIDRIDAEVLYPTLGMPLFGMTDGELQHALLRRVQRLAGGVLQPRPAAPVRDGPGLAREPRHGAAEDVARVAEAGPERPDGLGWPPPEERPYRDPSYDPFWQRCLRARAAPSRSTSPPAAGA